MSKKRKGGMILLFSVIGIIVLGSILAYSLYTGDNGNGNGNGNGINGNEIDMTFEEWTIENLVPGITYITRDFDYITINDNGVDNTPCSARLGFTLATEGTWKFKFKNLKYGGAGAIFRMRYGEDTIFTFHSLKYHYLTGKRRRIFNIAGYPGIVLTSDGASGWHDITISFKIDGYNSEVTVVLDGVTYIDKQVFSSSYGGINNVYFQTCDYPIATEPTHLILESLVIS